MNLTREQIFRHLHAVHELELGWEASRDALLAAGSAVVPVVVEVLEIAMGQARGVAVFRDSQLLRLAELVAEFADPRTLWPLLRLAREVHKVYPFFRQVLGAVGRRASPEDIQALLELLTRARPRWTGTALTVELQAQEAVWIATVLVNIAERDPKPELRTALALLKPGPFLPLEFIRLRGLLKAALSNENLPIPATNTQTTENLPIPAPKRASDDG